MAFYRGVDAAVVSGGCVRFHDLRRVRGCTSVVLIIGINNVFRVLPRAIPCAVRVSHRSRQNFREDRAIVKTDDRHVCVLYPSPINYVMLRPCEIRRKKI